MKYPPFDPTKAVDFHFPENQYYKEVTEKHQIVLHHTASGPGVEGDANWWLNNPEHVATSVIVGRDGVINKCFPSLYWAHHIGTHLKNNVALNKGSIGIEIDAWGPLWQNPDGSFRSYMGAKVPAVDVTHYPSGWNHFPKSDFFDQVGATGKPATYYHKYSDAQILAVAQLLEAWSAAYNIPLFYKEDMWSLSSDACSGLPGVWTHVSYREDKQDCHPQPEFIAMLKNLTA